MTALVERLEDAARSTLLSVGGEKKAARSQMEQLSEPHSSDDAQTSAPSASGGSDA